MTTYSLRPHQVFREGVPISDVFRNWYDAAEWAVVEKHAVYRYEAPGLRYAHCFGGIEIVNCAERDATGLEDLL